MLRRYSIAELQAGGVKLRADEAVAIAQQLIRSCQAANHVARPPFGPPTPANVLVTRDGTVTCAASDATCAISEIGIFLQGILPHVIPGSLRYTVARAALEVDAPPFDSLDDFSRALARHETGDRVDLIRGLIDRSALNPVDRRRSDPAIADLRRQLRESDARVYDQQRALDELARMTPSAPRPPRRSALAAGLVVGVALIGAGEWIRVQDHPPSPPQQQELPQASVPPAEAPADGIRADAVEPVAEDPSPVPEAEPAAPMHTTPVVKRSVRQPPPSGRSRARGHRSRFDWLRTRFVVRADPL
jgi:hypothetical protein